MSDKEYIMDILDTEKSMSVNMTYALNEASCDKLYKEYFKMFESINKSAKDVFNLAYKNGFYELEEETGTKINKAIKTLTEELEK